MVTVRAGFCDQVEDTATRTTVLCGSGAGDDSKILIGIQDLRLESLSADADIVNLLAVQKEVVGAGTCSIDLRVSSVAELVYTIDRLNTWNGYGKLERVKAEYRKGSELPCADRL